MTLVYKLTDANLQTHGGHQWTVGEWVETSGEDQLCGPGWIHCYSHPLLAVLLNPIHANVPKPRLWEAEADGATLDDHGLKQGYTRMRLIREIPLPEITTEHRVTFGISCAMAVAHDPDWRQWASDWLSGADRSAAAAAEAEAAMAEAAKWAPAERMAAAEWVAEAAKWTPAERMAAVEWAAMAAWKAKCEDAAEWASMAARKAKWAATATARAAEAAAKWAAIDLIAIAEDTCK